MVGSYVVSNSVKKAKLYSSFDLSAKSTYILFCAKNMNQYTDYLYIQPINDLLGFKQDHGVLEFFIGLMLFHK